MCVTYAVIELPSEREENKPHHDLVGAPADRRQNKRPLNL